MRFAPRTLRAGLAASCRQLSQQAPPPGAWREATEEVKGWSERVQSELLTPINSRLLGPLEQREFSEAVPLPFVLLLGNHSSGKSSFINYVLGRKVQQTGVAPTDDGFTVIAPAARDADRDGASFVGDPSMGFSPLRAFGPGFLSHFRLKLRDGLQTNELMLVDSPGTIPILILNLAVTIITNDTPHRRRYASVEEGRVSLSSPGDAPTH